MSRSRVSQDVAFITVMIALATVAHGCGKATPAGATPDDGSKKAGSCADALVPVLGSANQGFNALPGLFTASPLDPNTEINYIGPLGNLNAPGHVFPSDHIYLYMQGATTADAKSVHAPAGGTVVAIKNSQASNDSAIYVQVDQSFQYFFGHVGSSRVDLQACKLEYSIVSPK